VVSHWISSLAARYELNYGPDDFVLETTPLWDLQKSEMSLIVGDESFRQSTIALTRGQSEVRFARIGEVGHPLYASAKPPGAILIVKFPDSPLVRLRLEAQPESSGVGTTFSSLPVVEFLTSASVKPRQQRLALVSVQIGDTEFPLSGQIRTSLPAPTDDVEEPSATPARPDSQPAVKPATTTPAPASGLATPGTPPTKSAPHPIAVPDLPVPRVVPPKLPVSQPADGPKLIP